MEVINELSGESGSSIIEEIKKDSSIETPRDQKQPDWFEQLDPSQQDLIRNQIKELTDTGINGLIPNEWHTIKNHKKSVKKKKKNKKRASKDVEDGW